MPKHLLRDLMIVTAAVSASGVLVAPVSAQGDQPPDLSMQFSVPVFGQHVFNTDVDGGGELSITRLGARIGTDIEIDRDLKLSVRGTYELSLYDFSGLSDLGDPDPWEDIHTLTLHTQLQWSIASDWTIFGGPVIRFSRESGADWDQGLTGGALFGATYVFHEGLVIGGGFGVTSQIEDDALVYPVLVLDWTITDELRLVAGSGPANLSGPGLELVYDPPGAWSFGFGGRYELRRFRLNDTGIAPSGVGEETSVPLWLRASYEANESVALHVYAGISALGELTLDDTNGIRVGSADYDPTPTLAFMASFKF